MFLSLFPLTINPNSVPNRSRPIPSLLYNKTYACENLLSLQFQPSAGFSCIFSYFNTVLQQMVIQT